MGVGALTFAIHGAARDAIATSRNRIALTQASWTAQACVADVRAVLSDSLETRARHGTGSALEVWSRVNHILGARGAGASPCDLTLRAVGSRIDVNAADEATLARLLRNVGLAPARADSAAAELARRRPFINVRELRLVRGLETVARLDTVLDVEPGAISLNHAPREVLALLPGFTEEAIEKVLDVRHRSASINTLHQLSEMLSPGARAAFDRAFPRLVSTALLAPPAWVVTVRSRAGTPTVTAVVEVRLAHGGSGTGIVRRRSWIE